MKGASLTAPPVQFAAAPSLNLHFSLQSTKFALSLFSSSTQVQVCAREWLRASTWEPAVSATSMTIAATPWDRFLLNQRRFYRNGCIPGHHQPTAQIAVRNRNKEWYAVRNNDLSSQNHLEPAWTSRNPTENHRRQQIVAAYATINHHPKFMQGNDGTADQRLDGSWLNIPQQTFIPPFISNSQQWLIVDIE